MLFKFLFLPGFGSFSTRVFADQIFYVDIFCISTYYIEICLFDCIFSFWPSGFFYVATMIAITWLLEINLLDEEEMCLVLSAHGQQNYTNDKVCGICYVAS